MKYSQPYKEIYADSDPARYGLDRLIKESEEDGQISKFSHPIQRGKRANIKFIPFPKLYMERFTEARKQRSSPTNSEKVQEVVLPWEMKYFSPMLRG